MIFCHSPNFMFSYPSTFSMCGAFPFDNPFSDSNFLRSFVFGFAANMANKLMPAFFNPFMMNSDAMMYCYPSVTQNIGFTRYNDYTTPIPSFESVFQSSSDTASVSNFNFNFENSTVGFDTFNFSGAAASSKPEASSKPVSTTKIESSADTNLKGNEVPDGTSLTIPGLDYSVFGKYADKIKKLRPEMQKKVELLFKYCRNKGWNISLTSGFRSREQQEKLWRDKQAGRKKCAVARPGTSRHEYGCAVDIAIDGSSNSSKLLELGKYAETIGVRQGLSFGERWHFDVDPKSTPKGRKEKA